MVRALQIDLQEKIVLAGAALVSGLLHVLTINKWSIWHDESFTIMALDYGWSEMLTRLARDVHPPLYYMVLKVWSMFAGGSVFSLRIFSVILSVSAIILAYLLVRRSFDKKRAYWALLFLVLGPLTMRFGFEIRMYSMAAVFILLNMHAFTSLRSGASSRWVSVGYILSLTLAVYTHYLSGLIVLAQIFSLVSVESRYSLKALKPKLLQFLKLWVASGVLFLPWLPTAYSQFTEIQGGFWIRPVSHESFYSTLTSLTIFHDSYSMVGVFALFGMIVVSAVSWVLIQQYRTKKEKSTRYIILGIVLPVAALFFISVFSQSVYYDRYFAQYGYLFYSYLGLAVGGFYYRQKAPKLITLAVVGVCIFGVVFGAEKVHGRGDYGGDRENTTTKQVSEYIRNRRQPGDTVISSGPFSFFDLRAYEEKADRDSILMYEPEESSGLGNYSLLYDRDDIKIRNLEDITPGSVVWYVSGAIDSDREIPSDWREIDIYSLNNDKVKKYLVED